MDSSNASCLAASGRERALICQQLNASFSRVKSKGKGVTFVVLQHLIERLPTFLSAFFLLSSLVSFDLLLGFEPFVVSLNRVVGCSH